MKEIDFILLIPYYNNFEGLVSSLKSVQYPNNRYEILIVDDGSVLPLDHKIIQELKQNINIHLIRLHENQGVLIALNSGLEYLDTRNDFKYIARLDCGDLCMPNRFSEQVTFLEEHPEIGLLGTWCRFTEIFTGNSYLYKSKTQHNEILKEMHFKCSFIHPTVMFRREIIDTVGFYPSNFPNAEDYAYFWEIAKKYNTHILDKILVLVTIENGVSQQNRRIQMQSREKIIKKYSFLHQLKFWSLFRLYVIRSLPYCFVLKLKKIILHSEKS